MRGADSISILFHLFPCCHALVRLLTQFASWTATVWPNHHVIPPTSESRDKRNRHTKNTVHTQPAGLNPETLSIPAPTCGQWTTDLESVFDALGLTDSPPSIHPLPSFESARPNQHRYQRAAIAPWDQPWVLALVSCVAAAEAACSTLAAVR